MTQEKQDTVKLGILTCANATQEMDCCSVSCLRDFNRRSGGFAQHPPDKNLRLVGIISCSGCPTLAYPEKILRRVNSLVRFGVTGLHFSNCMAAFCPFLKKYVNVISKRYPDVTLIAGTHERHISDADFCEKLHCAFEAGKKMPDVILGEI